MARIALNPKQQEIVKIDYNFGNIKKDNKSEILEPEGKDDKKAGITGLFKKIIKEPDETQEELNNNTLEEVFKYRQGLKNESYNASNDTEKNNIILSDNNESYSTAKTINDNELYKNITLGNTIISSDTKEIDVLTLAAACEKAKETAYKAVMKPKEGTILTVARGIADKAM